MHIQPDGSRAIVERGVPLGEVNAEGLSVGRRLHVTLPEFNLSGDFTVTGIDACPTPARGDGHLVTSRFIHENTEVWDLSFERGSAPLGTTASHPFWSEDRQDFVAARDLHLGERLLLADGTTRRLESLTKRPERTTVYNIEVNSQHTYYVGLDGVLVHNVCGDKATRLLTYSGPRIRTVRHHIFNLFRGNSPKSQKYRDFFKKHDIHPDDFAVDMPEPFHKGWIHKAGQNWTTIWKRWIDANPNATTKEVYQQAGRMMDQFGISHLPIIPYK